MKKFENFASPSNGAGGRHSAVTIKTKSPTKLILKTDTVTKTVDGYCNKKTWWSFM